MKYLVIAIVMIVMAVGFNLVIDAGCKLQGIITTEGKVCID